MLVTNTDRVRTTISLPASLHNYFRKKAIDKGKPFNELVVDMLAASKEYDSPIKTPAPLSFRDVVKKYQPKIKNKKITLVSRAEMYDELIEKI
jgi:hypothetical protein